MGDSSPNKWITVIEQVRTPSSHSQLQILLPTESRWTYCQDYPPVTLSELRISLITKEFKDPVNLILFALPPVWHWCSRESIGWRWGTPNCICIATRNQVHKCYDILRQTAVSANLSRRPEINVACGSTVSSEENKNDGLFFFPITPCTSIKKEKIKMQSSVPKIHVVKYKHLPQRVESFHFWPCASWYTQLSRRFTTTLQNFTHNFVYT